jgi:CBS-domain-containing membrane protein
MNPDTSVDEMARRLGRLRADQVMVTSPKTMPAGASVADVRTALADEHVHMVLLTDHDVLRGTIVRADLTPGRSSTDSALELSTLAGRTVLPSASAADVISLLRTTHQRRLAVVAADGRLLGLICLKRRLDGFCDDRDVASRGCAPRSAIRDFRPAVTTA